MDNENNFLAILMFFTTAAMKSLGEVEDPVSGKKDVNLDEAAYIISLLETLKDKTKGNLIPQEADNLEQSLYILKQQFIKISAKKQ